jgi:hypothetical protein
MCLNITPERISLDIVGVGRQATRYPDQDSIGGRDQSATDDPPFGINKSQNNWR